MQVHFSAATLGSPDDLNRQIRCRLSNHYERQSVPKFAMLPRCVESWSDSRNTIGKTATTALESAPVKRKFATTRLSTNSDSSRTTLARGST